MGQEKRRVASAKELYAAFGEKKQKVDSMAMVPVPSAEVGNASDAPVSRRAPNSAKKDVQVSVVGPDGDSSKIVLGKGVYVYLEPSAIIGKLGSLTLNDDVAWLGEAETSARGFGHLLEATKDMILVSQHGFKERQALQSTYDAVVKKNKELEVSLCSEKKKSKDLEKKLKEKTTQYGVMLKAKDEVFKAREESLEIRAVAQTRLDFMMEVKESHHDWDPIEEIKQCELLLKRADELEELAERKATLEAAEVLETSGGDAA